MKEYIKSFVIGSSFPVVVLFFLIVANIKRNYSYEFYSLLAPLYLGLMNALSLFFAKKWNMTLKERYTFIGLFSPLIVATFAFFTKAYTKTADEWFFYSLNLLVQHFFVFNIIVYNLEKLFYKLEKFMNSDNGGIDEEIQRMVTLIYKRGILAPKCKHWETSDRELKDASGVLLFYKIKERHRTFFKMKILGEEVWLVTSMKYIKLILDNSPFVFGVGKLKNQTFKSFMSENVGVSEGCPWKKRRKWNDEVLDFRTDVMHLHIRQILLENNIPLNFSAFTDMGKKIVLRIVFNNDNINPEIFNIFSEANSLKVFSDSNFQIDPKLMSTYLKHLNENISNPRRNSLLYFAKKIIPDRNELIHQIPHWMFPITGLIATTVPRLLLILLHHPSTFQKLINEISQIDVRSVKEITRCYYLRSCILEMLRLNNPVVTTFRTLLNPQFQFPESDVTFQRGTQFLILNNPILRDPAFFNEPNKYKPERWNKNMENSYYSIMFNQGPQKCPGKEMAIFITSSFIIQFLQKVGKRKLVTKQKIDVNFIPQMINPCKIKFSLEVF